MPMTEPPAPQRADAVEPETAAVPPVDVHDPAGLDLAQSTVKAVGARRRRRPRARRDLVSDPQVSGARPDDRDPKQLGEAFEHLVDAKGWATELNVHTVLARWSTLVGPVNAEHSWPESFTDSVLVVRAESSVWATSLRTLAPQLVARMNAEIGDGTITRIQVLGPNGPSWKHGRFTVRDGRGPRDTYG